MKVKDIVCLMCPFDEVILYESHDDLHLTELHRGKVGLLNDCYLDSVVAMIVPLEESFVRYVGMVVA